MACGSDDREYDTLGRAMICSGAIEFLEDVEELEGALEDMVVGGVSCKGMLEGKFLSARMVYQGTVDVDGRKLRQKPVVGVLTQSVQGWWGG